MNENFEYTENYLNFIEREFNTHIVQLGVATEAYNLNPKLVVDIGAHKGDWSAAMYYWLWPDADYLLFEADINREKDLEEKGFPYAICLLGSKLNKEETFYYEEKIGTGNGIYKENSNYFELKSKSKTIKSNTLDNICKKNKISHIDVLKLDVQGSELDILKGSTSILKNTDIVVAECQLLEFNKGAAMFGEVIGWMDKHNFNVIDVAQFHRYDFTLKNGRKEKITSQMDMIFLRKDMMKPFNVSYDLNENEEKNDNEIKTI